MKEFITIGYQFSELPDDGKEKVKEWYLNDDLRADMFTDYIKEELKAAFPHSFLYVQYSLSYCQGDGLNIYGDLNLYDFLEIWNATEKEKKTIKFYLNHTNLDKYTFEYNNRYGYSCKFIDKKYISDSVNEVISDLEFNNFRSINKKLLDRFFMDMLEYFENRDRQYEKEGYKYFYEVSDEEVSDFCDDNGYYFDFDGNLL